MQPPPSSQNIDSEKDMSRKTDSQFRCNNMSKTASASEEPNLFELFRAPKVFETKSQSAPQSPTIGISDFLTPPGLDCDAKLD
jgi:hypothetical protein